MANQKTSTPLPHHRIRTVFAAFFGFLAMMLVVVSILVVWANRTLTDTNTYVQTVGPVIQRPELQEFVATKVTEQVLASAPLQQVAASLLPPDQVAGKTPEQLKALVTAAIHDSVLQILRSPDMQKLWQDTNRNAHAELVRQLDAGSSSVTIDLGPLVNGVLGQLKQTKLAPVADKIGLEPAHTKVGLGGATLQRIRQYYLDLKAATVAVVLLTLLFAGLSVWISVHHLKTLRRMLIGTGISALGLALGIAGSAAIRPPNVDVAAAKLESALLLTLLHGLQVGCLVLGGACVVLAIGSKVYEQRRVRTA